MFRDDTGTAVSKIKRVSHNKEDHGTLNIFFITINGFTMVSYAPSKSSE
jgi:hypothetical protein